MTLADFSLSGRTALVTGGGTGLGNEFATALAEQGARLILVGRTAETLAAAVAALPGSGHSWVAGDLTGDALYESLAPHVAAGIDILVNNAGGDPRKDNWLHQSPDDLRHTLDLNLVTPWRLAQLVAPGMCERGWGRIVNIASVYGVLAQNPDNGQPGLDAGAYTVAKHGLTGLTRFLAARLGANGVTANTISPGMFPSNQDDPALADKPSKQLDPVLLERLQAGAAVKRTGRRGDLAGAIVFLASPSGSFVTGQNLVIDGGWSVW